MTIAAGTKLGHYEIRSQLGAGGMGEVYLSQDTKLDRKVALKVLPADVASNRDRMERFVREAKSAAALNHPHIAHIYEIGESGSSPTVREGVHFIAMEYIDGETLREKIHRDKAPLPKLLKYLTQVAEGFGEGSCGGHRAEALAILKELEEKYQKHESLGQYVALVYAGLGDLEQVFAWLEKDFQSHSGELSSVIEAPGFDSIRSDPRYADLLRRMGLRPW